MTQAITAGFAPAGSSALGLAAPAAAPGQPAGEGGLFAALLALLAPALGQTDLSQKAGESLTHLQAAVPDALDGLVEALTTDTATEDPPDAAELDETIDALLALLDTPAAVPPTVAEDFTGLVSDLAAAITGPHGNTAPQPAPSEPAMPMPDPAGEVTAEPGQSALLQKLVRVFDEASRALEASNPELAGKLAALARALPALPEDVLLVLEEKLPATISAAETSSDRLAQLLGDSRSPPAPRQPAPAFTQPLLGIALSGKDTDAADQPARTAKPVEESPVPATARPASKEPPTPRPIPAVAAAATVAADEPSTADSQSAAPASAASATPAAALPAALRAMQAAYQPPVSSVVIPQVAFEIVRQFEAGNSRFQIRLDPPELGRIDVRLDMDRGGNVHARLIVERPETLDLMQRDQRALHQALQQAGLDANRTNLEFSLRQNPFAGEGFGDGRHNGRMAHGNGLSASDTGNESVSEIYHGAASASALNLFV